MKEWKDDIVFLHRVVAGAADRSYGIHVAKLAGLPAPVLARAGEVLAKLEQNASRKGQAQLADDLPLFSAARTDPPGMKEPSPLEAAIEALRPDAMTPRQALEAIYTLKGLLDPPES